MRFSYSVDANRDIICSIGPSSVICFIEFTNSKFYTINWVDYLITPLMISLYGTEVTSSIDMLKIITSLVLL